ncbi:hypothetical protein [Rhodosalinus sp.]|uniref:hypothetical protein n=1 Tax=Rhodosalinus sp. TaxID=2047741 RepID=UPI00397A1487
MSVARYGDPARPLLAALQCGWGRPDRPPQVAEEALSSTRKMPAVARDERPDHPTPKPLGAFGITMRQQARGGLCHKPFCGSGLQIIAGRCAAALSSR